MASDQFKTVDFFPPHILADFHIENVVLHSKLGQVCQSDPNRNLSASSGIMG